MDQDVYQVTEFQLRSLMKQINDQIDEQELLKTVPLYSRSQTVISIKSNIKVYLQKPEISRDVFHEDEEPKPIKDQWKSLSIKLDSGQQQTKQQQETMLHKRRMTGFPNMHVIKKNIQNLPDMIAEEFEIRKPKPIIEDPIIERLRIEKQQRIQEDKQFEKIHQLFLQKEKEKQQKLLELYNNLNNKNRSYTYDYEGNLLYGNKHKLTDLTKNIVKTEVSDFEQNTTTKIDYPEKKRVVTPLHSSNINKRVLESSIQIGSFDHSPAQPRSQEVQNYLTKFLGKQNFSTKPHYRTKTTHSFNNEKSQEIPQELPQIILQPGVKLHGYNVKSVEQNRQKNLKNIKRAEYMRLASENNDELIEKLSFYHSQKKEDSIGQFHEKGEVQTKVYSTNYNNDQNLKNEKNEIKMNGQVKQKRSQQSREINYNTKKGFKLRNQNCSEVIQNKVDNQFKSFQVQQTNPITPKRQKQFDKILYHQNIDLAQD